MGSAHSAAAESEEAFEGCPDVVRWMVDRGYLMSEGAETVHLGMCHAVLAARDHGLRLEGTVGHGAQGVVLRGRCHDRPCAIKLSLIPHWISEEQRPELHAAITGSSAWRAEVAMQRVARRLLGENVPAVLDAYTVPHPTHTNLRFGVLVMELASGTEEAGVDACLTLLSRMYQHGLTHNDEHRENWLASHDRVTLLDWSRAVLFPREGDIPEAWKVAARAQLTGRVGNVREVESTLRTLIDTLPRWHAMLGFAEGDVSEWGSERDAGYVTLTQNPTAAARAASVWRTVTPTTVAPRRYLARAETEEEEEEDSPPRQRGRNLFGDD